MFTKNQFKLDRHKDRIESLRNPDVTNERSRELCRGVSLDVATALGAIERWPDDGDSVSYEFGNGCNITLFLNQHADGYDIYGSRHNRQGSVLNFAPVARIKGLDNAVEVQAAMYQMALELPGRRRRKR